MSILTDQGEYLQVPYKTNYHDELDPHSTVHEFIRSRISAQDIPPENTDPQQYSNDPRLLAENERLRHELANRDRLIASHRLLPPKAPSHASLLQCSKPRDFGLYYLIHYFSTKLSKDKQTEPKDFSTHEKLFKLPHGSCSI